MTGPKGRRRRSLPEQRQLAEGWLRRTGRQVTPEAVQELAPHVKLQGRPEPVEVQAFARLVRLGQVPTAAAVQGEVVALHARQARRERLKQASSVLTGDVASQGRAAAGYVQQHRDRTGQGPSWGDLARQAGWTRETGRTLMPQLREAGWLRYDEQPGSLCPGPAFYAARSEPN